MQILEFTMTGTKHSAAYATHKHDIAPGDEVEFEVDANNAYDQDAIKVLWQGQHIGWVPKRLGEAKSMLARLLMYSEDLMLNVTAEVSYHEVDNPVDMQLQVSVNIESWEE